MPHYTVTLRHLNNPANIVDVEVDASTWVEAYRRALDSFMLPHFWEVLEVAGSEEKHHGTPGS